eukprot:gene22804-28969_t
MILCDGAPSVVAASSGLLAGYLHDRDGYGIQNYRLPQRVESMFGAVGTLVSSLLPQRNAATNPPGRGGAAAPALRAPAGTARNGNTRQNLMNPYDIDNYGAGGGGGLGGVGNNGLAMQQQQQAA